MGTISKNLNALVNDILYHYGDAQSVTQNWAHFDDYAIVLRNWTGKSIPVAGANKTFAGGPAVVISSAAISKENAKIFWDEIKGTNEAGQLVGHDGITGGEYLHPAAEEYEGTHTYGTFTNITGLTLVQNLDGSAVPEQYTTDSTQDQFSNAPTNWGLTFGLTAGNLPITISTLAGEKHFGVPQQWEFWFKLTGNSPDTSSSNIAEKERLGLGPAFPWLNDSVYAVTGGYWLGAYGDITEKPNVTAVTTGSTYTDTGNAINDGNELNFILVPDLNIQASGDDGYQDTEFDSNDKIDELYYRFEISPTVTGSGNFGGTNGWASKPLATAMAPASGDSDWTKFIGNRVIYYKQQDGTTSPHTQASILALRASGATNNSVGTLNQDIIAHGVFDLNGTANTLYPVKDTNGNLYNGSEVVSIQNLPYMMPMIGGMNLRSSPLLLENSELPLTVVIERITYGGGLLISAGDMYQAFIQNLNIPAGLYDTGTGEYGQLNINGTDYPLEVTRLVYSNITSAMLIEPGGATWESGSQLNLLTQTGKKPVTYKEAIDVSTSYQTYNPTNDYGSYQAGSGQHTTLNIGVGDSAGGTQNPNATIIIN